jgi:hypothetical protein
MNRTVHVPRITADLWTGTDDAGEELRDPSWPDVEAWIRRLDGKAHTMVTLEGIGSKHLTIGGGAGRYVVYAAMEELLRTLCAGPGTESKISLFIGGQEGDYPDHIVVDTEIALRAAKAFFETGRLDETLRWEDK